MPDKTLRCGRYQLSLEAPLIMAIVNLTPDSFSGDGLAADSSSASSSAIAHAWAQIEAGADLIDLGAESSRPGAIPASLDEERQRLLPVLRELRDCGVPISVDTYKPEIMRAALGEGASMINDIYALRQPGAIDAVADSDCAVCLMHMQGEPLTMQQSPVYADVVAEVKVFLDERAAVIEAAGVARERLVLDPGFGFGKSLAHNLALLRRLAEFSAGGLPVLAGLSRKSMLGAITGRPVGQRLVASVTTALFAVERGARLLRVHDVGATRDMLALWRALG